MKDDYSFKYNAFGNTVLVFVSIAVAFVVLAFGTLPVAFAVIATEVVLFYYLCQHTYLTIDSEGIQLNMFISNDEYLPVIKVGSTDHYLKFLYYTSFLTPCALPSVLLFSNAKAKIRTYSRTSKFSTQKNDQ